MKKRKPAPVKRRVVDGGVSVTVLDQCRQETIKTLAEAVKGLVQALNDPSVAVNIQNCIINAAPATTAVEIMARPHEQPKTREQRGTVPR